MLIEHGNVKELDLLYPSRNALDLPDQGTFDLLASTSFPG